MVVDTPDAGRYEVRSRACETTERVRLVWVALTRIQDLVDVHDRTLLPHIERIESGVCEVLQGLAGAARAAGVSREWGLDILLGPSDLGPSPSDGAPRAQPRRPRRA